MCLWLYKTTTLSIKRRAMNYFPLTPSQLAMQARVADLADKEIAPRAAGYASRAEYPRESLETFPEAARPPSATGKIPLDNVRKSYVSSGGHATHYTIFCGVEGLHTGGPPNLLVVESDQVGWQVLEAWHGLGMRGNGSAPMLFNGAV